MFLKDWTDPKALDQKRKDAILKLAVNKRAGSLNRSQTMAILWLAARNLHWYPVQWLVDRGPLLQLFYQEQKERASVDWFIRDNTKDLHSEVPRESTQAKCSSCSASFGQSAQGLLQSLSKQWILRPSYWLLKLSENFEWAVLHQFRSKERGMFKLAQGIWRNISRSVNR